MRKILDTILQIENDSKAIVVDAQNKAREIKETAEKENAQSIKAVRTEAEESLLISVNNAKKKWEIKNQKYILSQESLLSDFLNTKGAEIEKTTDKIMAIIKKPRHKKIDE
jgi:hypothetical protein